MESKNICLKCGSKKQGGGQIPTCSLLLCRWCEQKVIADHDYSEGRAYSRVSSTRLNINSTGLHPMIKYSTEKDMIHLFVGTPPGCVTRGMWNYFTGFMQNDLGFEYVGPRYIKGTGVMHEFLDKKKPVAVEEIYGTGG